MKTLKEMVSGDQTVKFTRYFDAQLWYTTSDGFEFPVPVSDIGTATFLPEDRAMLFMRYIRKQMALIETANKEQAYLKPVTNGT